MVKLRMEELKYAVYNLTHRKLRSSLSALSILIGITAIYALVSFGLGIQNYVSELSEEAGTDKLFVQARGVGAPGTDDNFVITQDEVDFMEKINGVSDISGMYFKAGEIEFNDQKRFQFIIGMDTENMEFILETFLVEIVKGRQLKRGDSTKVVLGYNYQFENKIFDKAINIRDKIKINGETFEVIGFFEEVGNPSDDAQVYVLHETMERLYPESIDEFGFVMLRSAKGVNPGQLAERIEDKLRKRRGQDEGKEDFFVQTFEDALETFGTIFAVINGVLVLIALVSIVVAGVNIMNTMYTAVIERTKEIGIMKSIGARRSNIMLIFIIEAGLLGTIGGVVGVLLGFIVASAGGGAAASAGFALLKPIFPWYLAAGCIFFAFLIGAGSGILPSYRASQLHPVDALRYE